jgi:hypothetical protein
MRILTAKGAETGDIHSRTNVARTPALAARSWTEGFHRIQQVVELTSFTPPASTTESPGAASATTRVTQPDGDAAAYSQPLRCAASSELDAIRPTRKRGSASPRRAT